MSFRSQNQQGFSLVEMLVATALGLIVIAGMITSFAGNKRSNDINTAMANIQENVRYAMNKISADVRSAGFQGCIDVNNGSTTIIAKDPPTTKLRDSATTGSIVGTTGWSPDPPLGFTIPTATDSAAIVGTHTLALQFGSEVRPLLNAMVDVNDAVRIEGSFGSGAGKDTLVIVSDCDMSNLFKVSTASTHPAAGGVPAYTKLNHTATYNEDDSGTGTGSLNKVFGDTPEKLAQTMVMKFVSDIYYVGATGVTNDDGDPITALYKHSFPYDTNSPVEMVQGVENMRVSFGIRAKNGTLKYVTADHSDYDPAKVESIQLGLLMVSFDRITSQDDENSYVLAGQQIHSSASSTDATTHPKDRRMRLAFNTTINVRNRRDETI